MDLFSGEDEVGEGLTSAGRFTRVSHNQSGGIEEHAIVLGESIHNIIDVKKGDCYLTFWEKLCSHQEKYVFSENCSVNG